METKDLPTGIKLTILEHVATKPSSATEVSKALKISLPYALTQLVLLEAKNLIKSTTNTNKKQIGKPKKIYSIIEEYLEVTILGEGFGNKFASNNIDPQLRTYFQLLSKVKEDNRTGFSEYYWSKLKFLKEISALGIIKETPLGIELVAITTKENITILREQISTFYTVKEFVISCWVNTEEEFIEGLKRHDEYYVKLVKKAKVFFDKDGVFERLQGKKDEHK